MRRATCDEVRALAPELALNIASGEERAEALAHLVSCPECRRHVEEMSEVADGLLLLAPAREPAAGFESKVLEARPSRRRRWARPRAAAAAFVAVAAAAAGITWGAGAADRRLADRQREQTQALQEVNGRYFEAGRILEGARVEGQAFAYAGDPSWVYCVAGPAMRDELYAVSVMTDRGRRLDLGEWDTSGGHSAWGTLLPVDLARVVSLRLVGSNGDTLEVRLS